MMRLVFLLILALSQSSRAFACASCGSGGDDPLIMYPNEIWKGYLGLTRVSDFQLVDENGHIGEEVGPDQKIQLTTSLGRQINFRSFATVTIPYIMNRYKTDSKRGFGDPLLAVRYTILSQDLTEEYIPQVQVIASYRYGMSKSIYESKDSHRLDVFGSGFSQYRIGLDIWSGMTWLQYGVAHVMGFSQSKTANDHKIEPGIEIRSTATVGHTFSGLGKISSGINRQQISELRDNGELVHSSDQLSHSMFVTADWFADVESMVRATVAKQAVIFNNKNTTRSTSVTLSYMRSF